jgi:hypothetical protein
MNQTPAQRTIIFGTSLAAVLVVAILVLTGGREPAPAAVSAPAGEAALPMLDGVNKADKAPETTQTDKTLQTRNETPAKTGSKPASGAPLNN